MIRLVKPKNKKNIYEVKNPSIVRTFSVYQQEPDTLQPSPLVGNYTCYNYILYILVAYSKLGIKTKLRL